MPETLQGWLERAAAIPGHGIRILDRREQARWLSWAKLHDDATAMGAGLARSGVRPGDRVALVFPTGEEFLLSFFATLVAGAVPVPLYPPVRLGRLDDYRESTLAMLRAVQPRMILADPGIRRVLDGVAAAAGAGLQELDAVPRVQAGSGHRAPQGRLALIQFSSGTTREPRPVALSQRAVTSQVRLLNGFWPDTPEVTHSGVSWLPLYHDMGLVGSVFAALERPGTVTLLPPEAFLARPALWLRAISRYRATVSPAPDFAYALAVERIGDEEIEGLDLSCWRIALDGAESISAKTLRSFVERFSPCGFRPEALTPVYGLSEASLAVTFSEPNRRFRSEIVDRELLSGDGRVRPVAEGREVVSVGRPLPGVSLEIRDPEGEPLPEGRQGRIHTGGPTLMDGYFGLPEVTAEVLTDGWLDTGDLGFVKDGELFVTGRGKDVVVIRGRNFAPEEIERAACETPGSRNRCAVAVSRERPSGGGEELLVFLEHAPSATPFEIARLAEEASQAVRSRTGVSPERMEILAPGTLPRTSSGKLRRRETLLRWEAGETVGRDAMARESAETAAGEPEPAAP